MYMTVFKMTRDSILNADYPLDLNNSNEVHKWITKQQNVSRSIGQLLYKVINVRDEMYLYVQSKNEFNIENCEKCGLIFVKSFNNSISNTSDIFMFDIQTFPNHTINEKRMFLNDVNDRYNWLKVMFEKNGITLLDCFEYKKSNVQVKSKSIYTTSYKGHFKINNFELATNLLANGLGRLKTYGCGLILVK